MSQQITARRRITAPLRAHRRRARPMIVDGDAPEHIYLMSIVWDEADGLTDAALAQPASGSISDAARCG